MRAYLIAINLILLWAAVILSNAFHKGRVDYLEKEAARAASQDLEIEKLKVQVEFLELDNMVENSKRKR